MAHTLINRGWHRHCRARGVTFVELAVVLVILIAIGYLAVPMLTSSHLERLKAAARTLAADIEATRIECISHLDRPHIIVFDIPGNRYYIAAKSDPDTPLINRMDRTPYEMRFGHGRVSHLAGVTLLAHSLDGDNQLGFGKYGELDQADAATVTLECRGRRIVLTIDPVTGELSFSDIL